MICKGSNKPKTRNVKSISDFNYKINVIKMDIHPVTNKKKSSQFFDNYQNDTPISIALDSREHFLLYPINQ
jgi:hypothetical protein